MDSDGLNQRRLTDDPGRDESPSWSPDNSRIAFFSTRNSNEEVFVMDADGSNEIRLTTSSGLDNTPSWSHISPTP